MAELCQCDVAITFAAHGTRPPAQKFSGNEDQREWPQVFRGSGAMHGGGQSDSESCARQELGAISELTTEDPCPSLDRSAKMIR